MTAPGSLDIDVRSRRESVRVDVAGELDFATAPELEEALATLLGDGVQVLVVDLRGVTLIDSSGVRVVVVQSAAARACGRELTVLVSPAIRRVLDLCGVAGQLRLGPVAERAAALHA